MYSMDNPPPRSVLPRPLDPQLTIAEVMTISPQTIDVGEPLSRAHDLMREHQLRHLPVMKEGALVGLLSQRDLYFLEATGGAVSGLETIARAMVPEVYSVAPGDRVCDVARAMGEHKYGSAVVVDRRKVVGIFTATDALALLTRLTT